MRTLIILVLLVALAVAVGWITMEKSDKSVDIKINTQKVESAADKVIEEARGVFGNNSDQTAAPQKP